MFFKYGYQSTPQLHSTLKPMHRGLPRGHESLKDIARLHWVQVSVAPTRWKTTSTEAILMVVKKMEKESHIDEEVKTITIAPITTANYSQDWCTTGQKLNMVDAIRFLSTSSFLHGGCILSFERFNHTWWIYEQKISIRLVTSWTEDPREFSAWLLLHFGQTVRSWNKSMISSKRKCTSNIQLILLQRYAKNERTESQKGKNEAARKRQQSHQC